ncbi:DUF1428 family protein [Rhodoblastus sp.]|nr:DUF1428 family protein [Rhodoblastus sp.]
MATYQSGEKRDEVKAKAMKDPRLTGMEMCFDGSA